MKTTDIHLSKTMIINGLTLVAMLVNLALTMAGQLHLSAQAIADGAFVLAAANMVLRFFTASPITGSPLDPNTKP